MVTEVNKVFFTPHTCSDLLSVQPLTPPFIPSLPLNSQPALRICIEDECLLFRKQIMKASSPHRTHQLTESLWRPSIAFLYSDLQQISGGVQSSVSFQLLHHHHPHPNITNDHRAK